jgi:hypothetical protein
MRLKKYNIYYMAYICEDDATASYCTQQQGNPVFSQERLAGLVE